MREHHEVDKAVGKVKKLAGLAKLSVEQLTELHDATGRELARRAKEKSKNKKPSEMGDREFSRYKEKLFSKHEGDTDDE